MLRIAKRLPTRRATPWMKPVVTVHGRKGEKRYSCRVCLAESPGEEAMRGFATTADHALHMRTEHPEVVDRGAAGRR